MLGKCIECGFENDCIIVENELCAECNEDTEICNNCKYPCRTEKEIERMRINESKEEKQMDFTDILKNEIKRTINWDDLNIAVAYVKDRELIKNCDDVLIWNRFKV